MVKLRQPPNQLTLCFAPNRQLGPPVVEPPLLAVDAQALDGELGSADPALPPLSSGSPSFCTCCCWVGERLGLLSV